MNSRYNSFDASGYNGMIDSGYNARGFDAAGELTIGGNFTNKGTHWDGSSFNDFSGFDLNINHMVDFEGDLVVCGRFTTPANLVARYNGTSWSGFGSGPPNTNQVHVVGLYNGNLHMMSAGSASSSQDSIRRWSGSAWVALDNGINPYFGAKEFMIQYGGQLICGGSWFNASGVSQTANLAAWDGANWSSIADPDPNTKTDAAIEFQGDLIVSGAFTTIAGITVEHIARWNGSAWSAFDSTGFWGSGIGGPTSLTIHKDKLVGAGRKADASAVVAQWNGSSWTQLGSAFATLNVVRSVGGVLYCGNNSTSPFTRIGYWDGANWQTLGSGLDGTVTNLHEHLGTAFN